MSLGSRVRQAVRFVVHNWPLKLAAIALATLLYAGLVASQDSSLLAGPVPVTAVNQPTGTVVTNDLRDLDQVRYIAPLEVGRLRADDFEATVDLANVKPDGQPVSVRVAVTPVDPRVTVLDFQPRSVQVVLDEVVRKLVPVDVEVGAPPAGVEVGETTVTPEQVAVRGASQAVAQVAGARVTVALNPEGINVDRDFEADPVDDAGNVIAGVDLDPGTVHVTIPLFTNKQSKTVPVNPVVTGTPAQGFQIVAVAADPLVMSVEGDADQLAELQSADTAPVSVSGATRDVAVEVPLGLPAGVIAVGPGTVRVTVEIEALTETRTYSAGIRLDGREPGLDYALSESQVLLTLFGPVADLDRLGAAPIVVAVNVAGLEPGSHDLAVVPSLPSTVTLVEVSPETVTVTISVPPTPAPASGDPADPGASTSPVP